LRYLLDTNIISEAIKPKPSPIILDKLQRHNVEMAICVSIWHELLFGLYRLPASDKREKLSRYLYQVVYQLPILPYHSKAAEWYAKERGRLVQIGRTPPFIDGQIAAVAKVNQLILVTANVSDYAFFEGIIIENWFNATY